jgi:site-specific DNA-methyltransferase (adenine-specific)
MIELNTFYNEDCLLTIEKMDNNSIDCVITSPPYNMTKRKGGYADKQTRYDEYQDWKSEEEYNMWTCNIFNEIDRVLVKNGTILYNFSYSIENPSLPFTMISSIIQNTNFMVADTIIWKKSNSIPHPATYSVELCTKLMDIYTKPDDVIYDPFMGTGTTGLSSFLNNRKFIGSEISKLQVEHSNERLKKNSYNLEK